VWVSDPTTLTGKRVACFLREHMAASEYFKVAQTINDAFTYRSAGANVTGLTQASFTIRLSKDGVGNQSTTGITIAEVSAANNPGLYSVTASGSTGFPASTGSYDLVIFRASAPDDYWTSTFRITSDGTGAGTWGSAVFTATASNGRIFDGAAALAGATVRILNSSSVILAQTVSDSSGLWGPIYFPADGTYTISASKSSYTIATGSITVSSSIATGPAADITLTAVSATSGFLASNLWAYAGRMMRDRNGTKADQEKRESVDDALEMISLDKRWPKYHTLGEVKLNAAYATGTVAVTNASATVTLTGGTFPSWAALAALYVNGQSYRISTRDSNTQLTLATTWNQATAAAATFSLAQHAYTLPSDLQRIDQILFDRSWVWGDTPMSNAFLQVLRAGIQMGQTRARGWAIANDQIWFWPWPTEAITVNVLYYRRPAKLVTGTDIADWDSMHEVLLRRAIDYQVSLRGESVAGSSEKTKEAYVSALDSAFAADKTPVSRELGANSYNSSRPFRGSTIS